MPVVRLHLQRLPEGFDPFSVPPASSFKGVESNVDEDEGEPPGFVFRTIYSVSSTRAWDKLYLLLGLFWSILYPGYLDGVFGAVTRKLLALILLLMSCMVIVPVTSTLFFKAFCSSKLRPCLRASGQSVVR